MNHELSVSVASNIQHRDDQQENTSDKYSPPSFLYFLAIFFSFLTMGLSTGLIGPTLLKMGSQTNSNIQQLAYLFSARSVGFFIGTLVGGALIDRFIHYGNTLLAMCVFVMTITTVIVPFVFRFYILIPIQLAVALAMGMIDNFAQILTLRHYTKGVGPYIQALHCAFGVGCFISPLIVAPFLADVLPKNSTIFDNTNNTKVGYSIKNDDDNKQWHYSYYIIGCLFIPDLIWILFYAIRDEWCKSIENDSKKPNKKQELPLLSDHNKMTSDSDKKQNRIHFAFVLGVSIFLCLYVGCEGSFGSYLHTYAHLHLNIPKDIAAYLNSAFWGSFALGRFFGIFISLKIKPIHMIFIDLFGCLLSLVLILIFHRSVTILWVASIIYGLFVGSIYASAINWTEHRIKMTGKILSALAVGGSSGDAIIPLSVGFAISSRRIGPLGFIIIPVIVTVLATALIFILILCIPEPEQSKPENVDVCTTKDETDTHLKELL